MRRLAHQYPVVTAWSAAMSAGAFVVALIEHVS